MFNPDQIKTFHGANPFWDRSCVVMLFDNTRPMPSVLNDVNRIHALEKVLSNYLNGDFKQLKKLSSPKLILFLVDRIQCSQYEMSLNTKSGNSFIATEYYSEEGAFFAFRLAYNLALFLSGDLYFTDDELALRVRYVLDIQKRYQPSQTCLAMLKSARSLGIPFYPLVNSTKYFCYGQGANSIFFHSAASQFDSYIAYSLQQSKSETNEFLRRFAYPCTTQLVVNNLNEGIKAFYKLGCKVVVKPVDQGMGYGVSSNISTEQEFISAFEQAARYRTAAVLVEKHEAGFDHRITVADGQVIGAICRMPAMIIGDGVRTVSQLIEVENKQRPLEMKRQGLIKDIVIDENLKQVINKEGFSLDSIPQQGKEVYLRSNANISTGGVFKDVIDRMHPDNFRMVIDIARLMRLDVMGLDFMTTDISKSWKEQGVIIEINATPGILEELAYTQLKTKFSSRNHGRITTSLFLDLEPQLVDELFASFQGDGCALIDDKGVLLRGFRYAEELDSIKARTHVAICDPVCETLVISASWKEIAEQGLPLDYFDTIKLSEKTAQEQTGFDARSVKEFLQPFCRKLDVL